MKLGEKILKLRKKQGLSQEELGSKIGVTRQTISNWELEETTPNPKQLKALSQTLNVSIDELLDNDIERVLETKISNTEKLAGIIIKILKVIGVIIILYFILLLAGIFAYSFNKTEVTSTSSIELSCTKDNQDYIISVGSDGYFNCSNCSKKLQTDLKEKYIDFGDMTKTEENINNYFEQKGGTCE